MRFLMFDITDTSKSERYNECRNIDNFLSKNLWKSKKVHITKPLEIKYYLCRKIVGNFIYHTKPSWKSNMIHIENHSKSNIVYIETRSKSNNKQITLKLYQSNRKIVENLISICSKNRTNLILIKSKSRRKSHNDQNEKS